MRTDISPMRAYDGAAMRSAQRCHSPRAVIARPVPFVEIQGNGRSGPRRLPNESSSRRAPLRLSRASATADGEPGRKAIAGRSMCHHRRVEPWRRPTWSTNTKPAMSSAGMNRVENPVRTRNTDPNDTTLVRAPTASATIGTATNNDTTSTDMTTYAASTVRSAAPSTIIRATNAAAPTLNTAGQTNRVIGGRSLTTGTPGLHVELHALDPLTVTSVPTRRYGVTSARESRPACDRSTQ